MVTHICNVSGCFPTAIPESSSCDLDQLDHKIESLGLPIDNIYPLTVYTKSLLTPDVES